MASQQQMQQAEPQEQPYPQPAAADAQAEAEAELPDGIPAQAAAVAGTSEDPGPADGGIRTRAAERSAERAAALAATEGFHPLRMRPYVGEPDGEPGESTVRPLIVGDDDGPATTDLGMFPSMYSGLEYAPQEPPAVEAAVVRGRHRRRRRGIVVAAAAVAASALAAGAVAVTGQVMGDESATADRALPDASASAPDVELPQDASRATGSGAPPVRREAPDTSKTHTIPPPPPSTTPSAPPTATPTATTADAPGSPPPGTPPAAPPPAAPPPAPPSHPSVQTGDDTTVLRTGDSGPAVADLQRALTGAHVYRGPIDGLFDHDVQLAVTAFQLWHHISESPLGSYGPLTRAALTHPDHHH